MPSLIVRRNNPGISGIAQTIGDALYGDPNAEIRAAQARADINRQGILNAQTRLQMDLAQQENDRAAQLFEQQLEREQQQVAANQARLDAADPIIDARGLSDGTLPVDRQVEIGYATPHAFDPNVAVSTEGLFDDHVTQEQVRDTARRALGQAAFSNESSADALEGLTDLDTYINAPAPGTQGTGPISEEAGLRIGQNIEKAFDLLNNSAVPATGIWNWITGWVPTTPAYVLDNVNESISSQLIVDTVSQLRNEAANGSSGFGQITIRELDIFRGLIAQLDPRVGHQEYQRQLRLVAESYQRLVSPESDPQGRIRSMLGGALSQSLGQAQEASQQQAASPSVISDYNVAGEGPRNAPVGRAAPTNAQPVPAGPPVQEQSTEDLLRELGGGGA